MTRSYLPTGILLLLFASASSLNAASLHEQFVKPPDDCRIMMRWWWFGPAVTRDELSRELHVMKAAGIGGVEIQPVYPLELDDPKTGFQNQAYLSKDFLDAIHFVSETAHELGLRVDITLGSGWPYGGPDTPVTEAAGRLRIQRSDILPALENGEAIVAHFPQQKLYFISSRTGQQVKRPSIGAEGYVLDHYDSAAVQHHLMAVGEKLLQAFGTHPPYAVFSDSLEVYGSDWTPDFLSEFQKRRGYDLKPHLLALADDTADDAGAFRHDWGQTLTELAEERYLKTIHKWAADHHTLFRSQTYGEPPVRLSSGAIADLAEGEAGPQWRKFNTARWAASTNHLYGRTVTSTETFTWLHAPSFRATPLDMKAEADLHFIEGVNQLICHGWPYSPPSAGEPGWRFYASAAFNDHNPWFQVMPDVALYLQRISFLMRQGKPVNDVAIYLPTDDSWAAFKPGRTSVDKAIDQRLGADLIPQILNAGYTFDYVDDLAIERTELPYRIIILPGVERIPVATLERLQTFVQKGGKVILTRRLPSQAPGYVEKEQAPKVVELTHALVETGKYVTDEAGLGVALRSLLTPDLQVSPDAEQVIGFAHRKVGATDVYFVVNTSNASITPKLKFRSEGHTQKWDPFTGASSDIDPSSLTFAPYESKVIVFGIGEPPKQRTPVTTVSTDLSADWSVTFEGLHKTVNMRQLQSWAVEPDTKFYSGKASYEKSVDIRQETLTDGPILISFGEGEKVPAPPPNAPGMRALLESPVRECAIVYVNDKLAGTVWHPPFEVNVRPFLHPGTNQLKIVVANLAINEMAGASLPVYKLLNARYGERFTPQGFEDLHRLPAGILGPITLITK